MVKLGKFFGYSIFFVLSIIYMLPKVNMYYALEEVLQNQKVVNSDEKLTDKGFSLELDTSKIFYDSIEIAFVEKMNISLFGLYNTLDVQEIKLLSVASSFVPPKIENLHVTYSVVNPLVLKAQSHGDFGVAYATLNIVEKNVTVRLEPSKLMLKEYRSTLNNFTKNEEGVYSYEKTF